MLDARTARILAKENEEDIEARRRREMVERGRGFEIGEEVWREGLFKYRDVYIARW